MNMKKELLLGLFFITHFLGFAKDITFPLQEPLFVINVQNENDEDEEIFTGHQIIEYSLKFSLCNEGSENWTLSLEKYSQIKDVCIQNKIMELEPLARAERLNEIMYECCLAKYSFHQTKMDTMFTEGTYNCVSSSLLYLALAQEFGIKARVQETPNHAFITVYIDEQKIDVETTNPYGFNPGRTKAVGETKSGTQKFAVIPKTYYSNRKEISWREAVSLVGKNLCSNADKKSDYETAVPLSISIYEFIKNKSDDPRNIMDTIVSNFSSYAGQNKQNEATLIFLDSFVEKYGASDLLLSNYINLLHNSVVDFCNARNFEEAQNSLEKHKEKISAKNYEKLNHMIIQQKCYEEINSLFDQHKFLEAADYCDEVLLQIPGDRNILNLKNNALQNHAIEIHNSVQSLVLGGNYEEALKIIQSALELNPNSALLKKDEKILQQKILN